MKKILAVVIGVFAFNVFANPPPTDAKATDKKEAAAKKDKKHDTKDAAKADAGTAM